MLTSPMFISSHEESGEELNDSKTNQSLYVKPFPSWEESQCDKTFESNGQKGKSKTVLACPEAKSAK